MTELERRAREYIIARRKQELNHTDPVLDARRTEAHDAFMMQLDVGGIEYQDREHAARIAREIVMHGGDDSTMEWRRCAHCRQRYLWRESWESNLCPRCHSLLERAQEAEGKRARARAEDSRGAVQETPQVDRDGQIWLPGCDPLSL